MLFLFLRNEVKEKVSPKSNRVLKFEAWSDVEKLWLTGVSGPLWSEVTKSPTAHMHRRTPNICAIALPSGASGVSPHCWVFLLSVFFYVCRCGHVKCRIDYGAVSATITCAVNHRCLWCWIPSIYDISHRRDAPVSRCARWDRVIVALDWCDVYFLRSCLRLFGDFLINIFCNLWFVASRIFPWDFRWQATESHAHHHYVRRCREDPQNVKKTNRDCDLVAAWLDHL